LVKAHATVTGGVSLRRERVHHDTLVLIVVTNLRTRHGDG
jgi:hypothetical protein